MKVSYLDVFRTRQKFTVVIVGQPEEHIMDWNGCNFKYLALPKAMRKLFDTAEQAAAYKKQLNPQLKKLKDYASDFKGSAFHDSRMATVIEERGR